ncbi:MAG: hypothetical protein ABI905_03865 [Betaproteobacteria bacterium]
MLGFAFRVALVLCGICAVAPTHAQTAWVTPADGSWSTAGNWNAGVPTGSVDTSINVTGSPYVVSQAGGTIAARTLLINSADARLKLTGASLLTLSLTAPSTFSTGSVELNGGEIRGRFDIGAGFSVLQTGGSSRMSLNQNSGLIRGTAGTLTLRSYDLTWNNAAGATIEADGSAAIVGFGAGGGERWTNSGELISRNGAQLNVGGNTTTAAMGTLRVFDTARMNLNGVIDNTGSVLNGPIGGAFDATGAVITGGTIAAGAIQLRSRIGAGVVGLDLKGGAIWEGDVTILNNAVNFLEGSNFTGSAINASGAFGVGFSGPPTLSGKTITLNTIDANATTFTASQTVTLAADTVIVGNGFKLAGSAASVLINQGTIHSLSGTSTTSALGTLHNQGRIQVDAGFFTIAPGTLINDGIIEARAGTLVPLASGVFTQGATGELRGAGQFNINNGFTGGTLRPGDGDNGIGKLTIQININQPVTFSGPATFAMDIDGANADQLFFNNGSKGVDLGSETVALALTLISAPTAATYRIVNLPTGFQNLFAGTFAGLAQGSTVSASFGGVTYNFTVEYDTKGVTLRLVQGSSNFTLGVVKAGAGSGSVASQPAGIDCGATCTAAFASGASVTLTAMPAPGSVFTGWSGACTGTGSCSVTMSADLAATATFDTDVVRYVVTTTAETGPGSWTAAVIDINNNQCGAPRKRIEFNIPAATDPGCNATTGVCVVQVEEFNGRDINCADVEVDGTTQPGWIANTAIDRTFNGQLKIELSGRDALFVHNDRFIVRGIAFGPMRLVHFVRKVAGTAFVTTGPTVTGNYFGWRADGLTATGGLDGNRIRLNEGDVVNLVDSRIGSPSPADRNLIAVIGVAGHGIALQGASGSVIENNVFNLDRNGNPNSTRLTSAIFVRDTGNDDNIIRRNVIATPKEYGFVCIGQGQGNTLTENQIFDANSSHLNATPPQQWAIYLGDCNRQQAAPSITITAYGATVDVQGTLNSVANETYRIEFFHNDTPDEFNFGRAERFISAMDVTTNAAGTATIAAALPAFARNVSSTATRLGTGDTSPFSAAVISPPNIDKFTVTPSANAGGTISPATAQQVTNSFTATFTVVPEPNHIVLMGGTCGGTLNGTTYTTVPIDRDCTVIADFHLRQYSVVPSKGANGGMAPDTLTRVDHGATLSFLLLGDPGFDPGVTGTCGGTLLPSPTQAGAATFTTDPVTADCTVIASFSLSTVTHTVTPSAGAGGSINPSSPVSVIHGQPQTFTLIPSPGFMPGEIGGTCGGAAVVNSYTTIPITTDCTVVASFVPLTWAVTPSAGEHGTISPATVTRVNQGAGYNFQIQADPGYQLVMGGTCNGTLYNLGDGAYMFSGAGAVADCTLVATFTLIPDPIISVSKGGEGIGSIVSTPAGIDCPGSCSAVFPLGSTVTLTPVPAANSYFLGYAGCPQPGVVNTPCTFTADGNKSIFTDFRRSTVNIVVVKAGSGAGSVTGGGIDCGSTCTATVAYGPGIVLNAVPASGSTFRGFTGPGCFGSGDCTVNTGDDRTIVATFDSDAPAFTVTNTNGSGTGSFMDALSTIYNAATDFCLPGQKTIAFNIPAASDPGCDAATGICRVQIPENLSIRCADLVIDGYTQPGATPNTATDFSNNAAIKVEFNANLPGAFPGQVNIGRSTTHPFGNIGASNVTLRGIAFPRHTLGIVTGNSGSVIHGGFGGHVVSGNMFGWHADGSRASGAVSQGINIIGAFLVNLRIGGPTPADRNLVTYRDAALCCEGSSRGIFGEGVAGSTFEGNYLNIGRDGLPVVTNGVTGGISLSGGLSGGTPYASNNLIVHNVLANINGTPVVTGGGGGNTVSENLMFGHPAHLPGISFYPLGSGGSNPQLAPVVTAVTLLPAGTLVAGSVAAPAGETIKLEFFDNPAPYEGNAGRANSFAGNALVTAMAGDVASFSVMLPATVRNVAVTATRVSSGDTSTFSTAVAPTTGIALTVAKSGPGTGTVNGGGIDCGAICTIAIAPGATITLIATPAPGAVFAGWSGGCTNATGPCVITVNESATVSARFTVPGHTLTVTRSGNGAGKVTSEPGGIDCGSECSTEFPIGSTVTLTASFINANRFAWGGDCTGSALTCTITMNGARTVDARFLMIDTGNPTAVLTAPAVVDLNATFLLDASQSFDAEGEISSYTYTAVQKPPGSTVFSGDFSRQESSMSVTADLPGVYRFRLVVQDDSGNVSAPVEVTVLSTDRVRPTAILDVPARVLEGRTSVLSGARSFDTGGGHITAYRWSAILRPPGSNVFNSPNNTQNATLNFTPDKPGAWTLRLEVTDDFGNTSTPDDVTFTVVDVDTTNPTAVLSAPAVVDLNAIVLLDGTQSFDGEGEIAQYIYTAFEKPEGSTVFSGDFARQDSSMNITADKFGVYRFRLVVVDDSGNRSAASEVTVIARDRVNPTAVITAPTQALTGAVVNATGASSFDGGGGTVKKYRWSLPQRPTGSTAQLSTLVSDQPQTSFTPDRAGTYRLALTVEDDAGNASASVSSTLLVNIPDTSVPIAIIDGPITGKLGVPITLSGAASADLNGSIAEYRWTRSQRPSGSMVLETPVISSSSSLTFTPDRLGNYIIRLVVVDNAGNASAAFTQRIVVGDTDAPTAVLTASPLPVTLGSKMMLSGENSFDPGGLPLRFYAYTVAEAPPGSQFDANDSIDVTSHDSVEFLPDVAGGWRFSLSVQDNSGRSSPRTSLFVPVVYSGSPTAVIDGPDVGKIDIAIAFDGSASQGLNKSRPIVRYLWSVTRVGRGSHIALNAPVSSASPIFSLTPDTLGIFDVSLIVEDAMGLRSPATKTTVRISDTDAPVAVLDARPSPAIVDTPVTLDGSESFDVGGSGIARLSFRFIEVPADRTTVRNPPANIGIAVDPVHHGYVLENSITTFTPDWPGMWRIQLVATDNVGLVSVGDTISLAVLKNGVATAVIDGPSSALVGTPLTFDASQSSGAGKAIVSYRWSFSHVPDGSTAPSGTVVTSTPTFSFTPDRFGPYMLRLVVEMSDGSTSSSTAKSIKVSSAGIPVAVLTVAPTPAFAGGTVTLSGEDSYANDGFALDRYQFSVVSRPAGSTAFDTPVSSINPVMTFTPDVPGAWKFRLVVLDALHVASEADEISVAIFPGAVPAAPGNAAAVPGNGIAIISFSEPAANGSEITSYTVSCQAGASVITKSGPTSPITVTGLANGTTYSCVVRATNALGSSDPSSAVSVNPAAPFALVSIDSRKTHGPAGDFDLAIRSGIPVNGPVTVEPRTAGTGHRIVFTYNAPALSFGGVTATTAAGAAIGSPTVVFAGNEAIVTLHAIPDRTRVQVNLLGVNGKVNASVTLGFLMGDVNGSRAVDEADLLAAKSRAGQVVTDKNFMFDLNINGVVSASEMSAIKARKGLSLD